MGQKKAGAWGTGTGSRKKSKVLKNITTLTKKTTMGGAKVGSRLSKRNP